MERYKPIILLGLGIVVALITSLMTYDWLQGKTEAAPVTTERIAVAAIDIPWGKVLTKEMISLKPYLKESLPEGYFADADSLDGRVLLSPLKTGEPIFEYKLAPKDVTSGGVSAIISPNKRAMAVKVDKVIGVSGFIHPGNRVDVLVTLNKSGRRNAITKTILENVLVLAAGTKVEKDGKTEKAIQVDVITLEVTPTETEKLALAATEGKIQLAMRNFNDTADVLTSGSTNKTLLASYSTKKRYRKKNKAITVEMIKGNEVSKVKIKER